MRIRTISIEQMLSLSLDDLITKLSTLFALVVGLFGAMVLGAGLSGAQDFFGRQRLLQSLTTAGGINSCGFRELSTGEWLWALPPVVVEPGGSLYGALQRATPAPLAAAGSPAAPRTPLATPPSPLA